MKKILIALLFLMLISSFALQESYAKTSLKKSDEKRCTNNFKKFLSMGEDRFLKRYPHYSIMDKCLTLYKDPDFLSKHDFQNNSYAQNTEIPSKIISAKKIGQDKYLIHFSMCYDEKKSNYIFASSDLENVIGGMKRTHNTDCPSLWMIMHAHNPSEITFSWHHDIVSRQQLRTVF